MDLPSDHHRHRVTPQQLFQKVQRPAPGPGLGDVVAGATKAVGIKPCGGCQTRQAAMNAATPGYLKRWLAWLAAAPVMPVRPSPRP
jgi:hypothetical protein